MQPPDIVAAPDETVFGIAARQHRLSGNRSSSDSLLELFGSNHIVPGSLLPGHLGQFFDSLGLTGRMSYSLLIDQHTVLPYWRLFAPIDRYQAVQSVMWRTAAIGVKLTLGLISSRLGGGSTLRYCDACAESDLANLGVPTWHRKHQMPGVLLCPDHALALNECDHLSQQVHRHTFFLPDDQFIPFNCPANDMSKAAKAQLLRIAVLSTELLNLPWETALPTPDLRARFLVWLDRHDLVTTCQRVRVAELQRHVADYWAPISDTEPFASLFASIDGDHSWLNSLVRKQRGTHHPLKQLLLIGAISPSVDAFLHEEMASRTTPAVHRSLIGAADSPVASQALHLMKDERHSARYAARELGVDVQTILTIAHRHGVEIIRRSKWIFAPERNAIRQLLRAGTPLTEIVQTLGISASTVSRVLAADPDLQRTRREVLLSLRREGERSCLLGALEQRPLLSPSGLRQRVPACYAWLYRHDRAWLGKHLLDLQPGARTAKSCVDWRKRDASLAKAIRLVAQAIRASEETPVRVTLRELGRRTGRTSWLEKHRAKLPICNILLQDVLETVSEFQARRLKWWDQHLTSEEGIPPAPSRLRRLAGMPSRRRASGAGSLDRP
ncbi:TnsD family Tn7-like transposition protein [Ralstonia pseudosolanacearum]|uniref:TnsD family Tn7-like transposition protein n=1 Tax=Ralstonia pseudosolanacearum TaxID=1310165 RepID=UPI0013155A34|nr:TnsD family Tn7-like transposition protein [Ralstonia pseudosolanacearum]